MLARCCCATFVCTFVCNLRVGLLNILAAHTPQIGDAVNMRRACSPSSPRPRPSHRTHISHIPPRDGLAPPYRTIWPYGICLSRSHPLWVGRVSHGYRESSAAPTPTVFCPPRGQPAHPSVAYTPHDDFRRQPVSHGCLEQVRSSPPHQPSLPNPISN